MVDRLHVGMAEYTVELYSMIYKQVLYYCTLPCALVANLKYA